MVLALLGFFVWKTVDIIVGLSFPIFIPYLGFFPYKETLSTVFHLPPWIYSWANFDGIHYILIALNGYSQYEQAFFPLYPLMIRFFNPLLGNNLLLTGLFISNLSFFLGLYLIVRSLPETPSKKRWFLVFLLAFPTSFFFGAVYTEGLFFLLFGLFLFLVKKKYYLLASLTALIVSLTRLVGIFIPIILFFELFRQTVVSFRKKDWLQLACYALYVTIPFFGLLVYCFFLWQTTSDPFFFFSSQPIFGAHRSTHLILLPQVYFRYFKIFITARPNFQYFISLIEFFFFTFVFLVLLFDLYKITRNRKINPGRLSLNIFSLINLCLPTLTGTFSSIPRYTLFSLSFFIFLAGIKNNTVKLIIAGIFFWLHIMMLGFFIQGYFVS